MPPSPLDEIEQLIAPGRSGWERLVHLRRAWAQVRALSPADRERLALKLGLEKGSDVLDRLVEEHPERAPPRSALRALRDLDPEAVRGLARNLGELRDETAIERLATLESAANTVAERVLDPIADDLPAAPPAGNPFAAPPAAFPPAAPPASPSAVPPAAPRRVAASPPAPPPAAPRTDAAPAARGIRMPALAARCETASLPATMDAQDAIEPLRASAPAEASWVAMSPGSAPRVQPTTAPPPALPDEAIARLARLPLLRRLGALRLDLARQLTPGDARRVLRAFPDGWARRRAFLALLDEGIALDAGALEELGARSDRRWCERALRREALPGG